MKQGVMKKVFKVIAFVFIGMFLYGVVTFTLMTIKYGLHFGYVSNGDIELISGLLVTAVILGAMLLGSSDGKSVVSGYSYGDDDTEGDVARGMIGDMSSPYYMMFDNDD